MRPYLLAARRPWLALALLLAGGCADRPGAPGEATYAIFDPDARDLPQPHLLALEPAALAALPAGARRDLLEAYALAGGYPDDAELPASVELATLRSGSSGGAAGAAPDLDLASLSPSTLVAVEACPGGAAPVTLEPAYVKGPDRGRLAFRRAADGATGLRRWTSGCRVVIALRGGALGLRTTQGDPVQPQPATRFITQGKDLSLPENQGDLPGATAADRAAAGARLEAIRRALLTPAAVDAIAAAFPLGEAAVVQVFPVQGGTRPVADLDLGAVPWPSDLLLDPTATGRAVGYDAAFGPLAPWLAGLDGFSTTAMGMVQTTAPIRADTVTGDTLLLYDLSAPAGPVRVPEAAAAAGGGRPGYLAQPARLSSPLDVGGVTVQVAPLVAFQPAVATAAGALLPPLREDTDYAVVLTSGVLDAAGRPLRSGLIGKALLARHPLHAGGASTVPELPADRAARLEPLRLRLQAALDRAALDGVPRDAVALAYTFRTRGVTGRGRATDPAAPPGALQLAHVPYGGALAPGSPACVEVGLANGLPQVQAAALDCRTPLPGSITVADTPAAIAAAYDRHGVDPAVPRGDVGTLVEATIVTLDLLEEASGRLDLAGGRPVQIRVLVAAPSAANPATRTCTGLHAALAPAKCIPLVVFAHGFRRGRADALLVANALNGRGIAVAALDLPKHGERSWCRTGADCVGPAECVPEPTLAGQGDAPGPTPGRCRLGSTPTAPPGTLANGPTLCLAPAGACTFATPGAGQPLASGSFFLGPNVPRLAGTLLQSVVDLAQLVQAVAVPPAQPPTGNPLYDALVGHGLVLLPGGVGLLGQSLGAMAGALSVAADPRIDRAVLGVPGGTLADVLSGAPAFQGEADALFLALGVDRSRIGADGAVAARYHQTLHLLQWLLDQAEPLNLAGAFSGATLPNLLEAQGVPGKADHTQRDKAVLVQLPACAQAVPTRAGALLSAAAGLAGAGLAPPATAGAARVQWLVNPVSGLDFPADPANAAYPAGCVAGVADDVLTTWGRRAGAPANAEEAALTRLAQEFSGSFLLDPRDVTDLVTPATPRP